MGSNTKARAQPMRNTAETKKARVAENGSKADAEMRPDSASIDAAGGNVDRIREIIFGTQMRDYEKRFVRLEERLLKDSADLRDDVQRRLEQLESFIRGETETLSERLQGEHKDRSNGIASLTRELRDLSKDYEKKIAQHDEQITKQGRELRQQLIDQAKSFGAELRQKCDDLGIAVERELTSLRAEKTDRAALAALFSEVALRLNNEFVLPTE